MVHLVLASASPARIALLDAAGIRATVRVSGVDEDAVLAAATARAGRLDPAQAVLILAHAKAHEVAAALSLGEVDPRTLDPGEADPREALVLGCDSMLELDGEIFGKPATAAIATERWQQMRGRSATLHTGHCLVDLRRDPATDVGQSSATIVHFADLSDAEIADYVATGEPLAVAGAFTIDGLGGPFIRGIEGDPHGVVGLSLPLLRDLLARLSVPISALWSTRV